MGTSGAMAAYLDRNGRSKKGLMFSIFTVMFTYYIMYMASYTFWDQVTFGKTFTGKINDHYYFYVNILEMTTFVFVRTRSSIKYFSKYVTIANIIFLMYINSHMYAAQLEAFLVLVFLTIFFLIYFLLHFESKAI
jgi:hypothetical protein